jgi:hypothetical protein
MSRRAVVPALAAALAATAPSAFAAVEHPRAACAQRVNDAEGDGKYALYGVGSTNVNDPRDPSVDALDIVNVNLRYTAGGMETHLKVKGLGGAFGAHETGYRYDVAFESADGTKFLFQALRTNPQWDAVSLLKTPTPANYPGATYTVGSTATRFTGVTGEVDVASGWIVVTVPAAEFGKAFGDAVKDGVTLTKVSAATFAYLPAVIGFTYTRPADSTLASDQSYTVGDDFCFGPPPAALGAFGAADVQFTDATTLTATLKGEAGDAIEGKTVEFAVAGEPGAPLRGVTDADGVARVTYKPSLPAGTYPVNVVFPGDETDGRARLTGSVVVKAEGTRFGPLKVGKPSSTTRTVTATLLDDDKHAVNGQKVEWWVNGKRAATLATDGKGVSVFKAAKPGQSVQAKLVAVAGRFLAAAAGPVKA